MANRTSRRCFAGGVRTRHWCCRLTALITFLYEEKLVVLPESEKELRCGMLFYPFALSMLRWNLVVEKETVPTKACLRAGVLEWAFQLFCLTEAGFEFGVDLGGLDSPPWIDRAQLRQPLQALKTAIGEPPLNQIAHDLCFTPHTVGRWFVRGERPSREGLQVLAKYFGKRLSQNWACVYRRLYWHYSLADFTEALSRRFPDEEVREALLVCWRLVQCNAQKREKTRTEPNKAGLIAAMCPLPIAFMNHAFCHGASKTWEVDIANVLVARDTTKGSRNPKDQFRFLLENLPRVPGVRKSKLLKSTSAFIEAW